MFLTLLPSLSGELFHADGVGVTEGLVDAGGHGHAEVAEQEHIRVVGHAGEGRRDLTDHRAEHVVGHGLHAGAAVVQRSKSPPSFFNPIKDQGCGVIGDLSGLKLNFLLFTDLSFAMSLSAPCYSVRWQDYRTKES